MFDFIYHWIDLLWLPVTFFTVREKHRWWSIAYIIMCMMMMRMQAEFMIMGGFETGIMGLMSSTAYSRGLVVYTLSYLLLLLMAHFSPNSQKTVFMAACLGLFFMAFTVSMLLMIL